MLRDLVMGNQKMVVAILLILALPIVDLVLLFRVGKYIGFWRTLGLVFGTALLGVALLAVQGFGVYRKALNELGAGRIPKNQVIDGLLIVIGAVLILLPGPMADVAGFVLLFPLTRWPVRGAVLRWIEQYIYIKKNLPPIVYNPWFLLSTQTEGHSGWDFTKDFLASG